ncbi:MAG: stage III sporulation protein AD [Clostridiales bacterium]|jgi:stage III sporulation protein AD|nr:stage III sporulation protein AD [Clostridiales bacterium]
MDIFQASVVGASAAVLSLAIKKQAPEISLMIAIAAGTIIFIACAEPLFSVVSLMKSISGRLGGLADIAPVIKIIGIAAAAEFASQICADAGERAIAAKIEFLAKTLIIVASAPVLVNLLYLVTSLT